MINSWKDFIKIEKQKDYYKNIVSFLMEEGKQHTIYPPSKDIFTAFTACPLDKIKILILAQDPYYGPNQAHGLAFSVKPGVDIPPSLRNIYKEIQSDLGLSSDDFTSGYLLPWAEQGIFLLNSILTVAKDMPALHKGIGWEEFTDNAIKVINDLDRPIVIMLWGAFAKSKKKLLTNPKHLILESSHPSPLGVNKSFKGCKHFSKANEFLINNNIDPIDWRIK